MASSVRAVCSTAWATSLSTGTPDQARVVHATRSGSGVRVRSSAYRPAGGGAVYLSPTAGPWMASSRTAASRTVRVSPNSYDVPNPASPVSGPQGVRPRLGFSPTRPQQDAGMRSEPAPSLPCASGTAPAATRAAAPPLDPPTPCSRFQGLRVGPCLTDSVEKLIAISGTVVTPSVASPAALNRTIRSLSCCATRPSRLRLPTQNGTPASHRNVLDEKRHAAQRPVRGVLQRGRQQRHGQSVELSVRRLQRLPGDQLHLLGATPHPSSSGRAGQRRRTAHIHPVATVLPPAPGRRVDARIRFRIRRLPRAARRRRRSPRRSVPRP